MFLGVSMGELLNLVEETEEQAPAVVNRLAPVEQQLPSVDLWHLPPYLWIPMKRTKGPIMSRAECHHPELRRAWSWG